MYSLSLHFKKNRKTIQITCVELRFEVPSHSNELNEIAEKIKNKENENRR